MFSLPITTEPSISRLVLRLSGFVRGRLWLQVLVAMGIATSMAIGPTGGWLEPKMALLENKERSGWPASEERSFESFRSYYEYLPKGVIRMEYTIRLNNVGEFSLPPSRVEAMYAPEMFGESLNAKIKVGAVK